jgi:hypothetical protein
MKLSYLQSIALAGLLGCCSGARAGGDSVVSPSPSKRTLLPIRSAVSVKEVQGHVQYAYDSTGWRELTRGKTLHPGATIRASSDSAAVLRVADSTSFYKVSALTAVHITYDTPAAENSVVSLASAQTGATLAED